MKPKVDLKTEKLAQTIQKKLAGNPLLLIGSGGSIPYGLPSMETLASAIVSKLGKKYQSESTWKTFVSELKSSNNLETALEKATLKAEIHSAVIILIWSLFNRLNRAAITQFLKLGKAPALSKILKKFVQQTGTTNVVTTNYDKIIEYAIDSAQGTVESGFSGDCVKTFGFFQKPDAKRIVNLYKVHGSIDWFKHKSNHKILATEFYDPGVLSESYEPMIVTPGNDKYRETHNDPFRTVIAEADKALHNSAAYLCVGYGFNDEHIQPIIIDESRNKQKPIVVVTKDITPRMHELFFHNKDCNCVIISEKKGGGTIVNYSESEKETFDEDLWCLDKFYKLWFE